MDIASLRAFIAVADTGSFSHAARQLCLTQPAVSKRIITLENQVGVRLFDRIGRRVTLTEMGQTLQPRAHHILNEVADIFRTIANLNDTVTGRLGIGTSHHIGLHRLPPILRTFTTNYPDVELDLRFMDSEKACKAVEHGDLELGIVTLPPAPPPTLHITPIWNDPLEIVVSPEHPLTAKKSHMLADLANHTAILPARDTYTREVLEQAIMASGINLHVRLSTNYLETIKMMVSVGLGWSILPKTMADKEICVLSIDGIQLQRTLGIVHHTARTQSNAAKALIAQLAENTRL